MKKSFLKYVEILKEGEIENPLMEIQRFVSDRFGIPLHRVIGFDFDFSPEMERELERFCRERKRGIPYSYLTGFAYFCGRKFFVNEKVLIPRPETEHIVEVVLGRFSSGFEGKILDCCTGSGNIAITLAKEFNRAEIFASDISGEALDVALKNSLFHNTDVSFILCDKLTCFKESVFDLIVANPPYISLKDKPLLEKEVLNEPHLALFGGEKGYEFFECFLSQSLEIVKENGLIVFEIGYNQMEDIKSIATGFKKDLCVEFVKDLNGYYRVGVIENA